MFGFNAKAQVALYKSCSEILKLADEFALVFNSFNIDNIESLRLQILDYQFGLAIRGQGIKIHKQRSYFENSINGYTSIENFFINNKKRINLSEYYGQVSMNLCIKCKKYAKRSLNYSK